MRREVRRAIRKKSALCLASLDHVRAIEEPSLLKNIRFWKLMRGKRIVLISKWPESFMKRLNHYAKNGASRL